VLVDDYVIGITVITAHNAFWVMMPFIFVVTMSSFMVFVMTVPDFVGFMVTLYVTRIITTVPILMNLMRM
jgi:hypothetical protein